MLILAIAVQLVLMIGVPLALFWWAPRRLGTARALIGWGALTFMLSQAVRWPLLFGLTWLFRNGVLPTPPSAWLPVFDIGVLCLTAGLFEETARYLGYRTYARNARTWANGVAFGLGHGGCEAIIFGVLAATGAINMFVLSTMDPANLQIVDAATKAQVLAQAKAYWAMPAYMPLLGGMERVFSMCFHVAMSLVVLYAVANRRWIWLVRAIALHVVTNAAAVATLQSYGAVAAEAVIFAIAALSLVAVFGLRPVLAQRTA